jgi:tripeptide aminopeptidase
MGQEFLDTFFQMVRIGSESGNESEFIDYLKNLFSKELHAKCVIDKHGNLIAKVAPRKTDSKEPVLFGVHADTVKPGNNIEPVLENGVIHSRGKTILGADDKAGITAVFEAVRTATCRPPVEIAVTRGEEVGLLGVKNLDFSKLSSKIGFVIDSDKLTEIIVGGPSYMSITVNITGRSAHAGIEPEKGASSIKAAAYAISMLKEGWVDDETTVNTGIIRGGEVLNSVPAKTEVRVECRSKKHEKCVDQSNMIKKIFQTAAESIGAKAEIGMELQIKCYSIPHDSKSVTHAVNALKNEGIEPDVKTITGGTDAAIYNEKGIETVVMGMGVRDAHTTDERLSVSDMKKTISYIQFLLKDLSRTGFI